MTSPLKVSPILALAAACSLAGAAAGSAQEQSGSDKRAMLEKAFGATILSTYPDGRQAELWMQRDGTYQMESRRHERSTGHWDIRGDKICLKQARPIPAPFSFCTPAPATIEKPWTAKAFTGETVTLQLVEGLRDRDAPAPGQKDSDPSGQKKAAAPGQPPADGQG